MQAPYHISNVKIACEKFSITKQRERRLRVSPSVTTLLWVDVIFSRWDERYPRFYPQGLWLQQR